MRGNAHRDSGESRAQISPTPISPVPISPALTSPALIASRQLHARTHTHDNELNTEQRMKVTNRRPE